MSFRIKFRGDWKAFLRFTRPGYLRGKIREEAKRTMALQVQLLRKDVLAYIDGAKHGIPNSPLTILIKGSSRPLVDRGDLRQSINGAVEATKRRVVGAVGVLRTKQKRGSGGRFVKTANVAAFLHEGFTIKVTPKVRAAVFAEMRKRRGRKKVRFDSQGSEGQGKSVWRVRGRPFIRAPFEAAEKRIILALGDGVKRTLKKS